MTNNNLAVQITDVYDTKTIFNTYWKQFAIIPGLTNIIIIGKNGLKKTYRILDQKVCLELGIAPDFEPQDAYLIENILTQAESKDESIKFRGLRCGNLSMLCEQYFQKEIEDIRQFYTDSQYVFIAQKIAFLQPRNSEEN